MKLVYVGIDRQLHLVSDWETGPTTVHLTSPPSFMLRAAPAEGWSWPTWSPDGQWIAAFAVVARDDESGPARVVTTSIDGLRQTEWADLPDAAPLYLQWHPAGTAICVLTQVDSDLRLGLIQADRLGVVKDLAQGVPLFFNWTPDGSRLWVHHGERGKAGGSLLIRDPMGEDEDRLYARTPGSFCAPVFCGGRTFIAVRQSSLEQAVAELAEEAATASDDEDDDQADAGEAALLASLVDEVGEDEEDAGGLLPGVNVDALAELEDAGGDDEDDEDEDDGGVERTGPIVPRRRVASSMLVSCDLLGEDEEEITARPGLIALAAGPDRKAALSWASGGEGAPYHGIDVIDVGAVDGPSVRRLSEAPLLAYTWVPGGAALVVFRVDAPANCMSVVRVDAVSGAEHVLGTFWPTRDLFFWLHFFDQFLDSHPLVSADGAWVTWSGYPAGDGQADLSAPPRVWVRSLVDLAASPIEVGRGTFATFAPAPSASA